MAYNRDNLIKRYKAVIAIVNEQYIEGATTYKGIWREYVVEVHPMCYGTFLKITNTPIKKYENEINRKSTQNGK